jgi:hypothetical protein
LASRYFMKSTTLLFFFRIPSITSIIHLSVPQILALLP